MRRILLILVALGVYSGIALADPSNLAGGVLIAHHPPPFQYCYVPPCDYYDEVRLTDASEQVNRIDDVSDYSIPDFWYVIAAFDEDKTWCGVQFGLGDYNPLVWYVTGTSYSCHPDVLEIPTAGWPGPNTGISYASTSTPFEGNYELITYFQGYTYLASVGDFTPTVVQLTTFPGQDFIGFGNCEAPAGVWPAEGGAMGFFTDGVAVYPASPSACCYEDGSCELTLEADCEGIFHPGETCDPNPCPPPMGACCFEDGSCVEMYDEQCVDGYWILLYSCDPNPCIESPAESPSWGEIKTLYR